MFFKRNLLKPNILRLLSFIIIGIVLLATVSSQGAKANPEVRLPRAALAVLTDSAPKIDGVFDESTWQGETPNTGFSVSPGGIKAAPDTSFRVAYDKRALYFFIQLEEPAMDQITAQKRSYDDVQIYQDDVVEIFLQPNPSQSTYYHLTINPLSARSDAMGFDNNVDINWSATAAMQKNGWSVEVEIPFASIGMSAPPKTGTQVRLNICRERQGGKTTAKQSQNSAWSFLTTGFHEQKDFGYLVFSDYNVALQKRFDDAKAKLTVLQRLLPTSSQQELSVLKSQLIQPTDVTSEEGFRGGLRLILTTEESLNKLLKNLPALAESKPNLVISHLNPYDSIAGDSLAQLVYYANVSSKQEDVRLQFKQAINEYEHDSL